MNEAAPRCDLKQWLHRTKIVCTLGPACSDQDTLERMILAGMDVARLNFSHGDYQTHAWTLKALRAAARRVGRVVGVLQDLCGPKIRLGVLPEEGFEAHTGDVISLWAGERDLSTPGKALPVEYADLARDLRPGMRLLFDDGHIAARVVSSKGRLVKVRIEDGGLLRSKKGINLPDADVSAPSVTPKDLRDLEWGLKQGVDFVALSFVRRPEDLVPVKLRLAKEEFPPFLISKIERPEAVQKLKEIVLASDGVMVARGDLGVEMNFEEVPLVQKRLIRLANENDIPVITATQMLDSMTQHPRPTRAEVSDVTNAIVDGSDAVMLSGETALGKYPIKAVETMRRIAEEAEAYLLSQGRHFHGFVRDIESTKLHRALAFGAERIARSLRINTMALGTYSGRMARYVASSRPRVPVLALTPNPRVLGRMALFWGIEPVLCSRWKHERGLIALCERAVIRNGLVSPGEPVLIVVGGQEPLDSGGSLLLHQTGKRGHD